MPVCDISGLKRKTEREKDLWEKDRESVELERDQRERERKTRETEIEAVKNRKDFGRREEFVCVRRSKMGVGKRTLYLTVSPNSRRGFELQNENTESVSVDVPVNASLM